MFILIRVSNEGDHPFLGRVKGLNMHDISGLLFHESLGVNFIVHEPVDEADLCAITSNIVQSITSHLNASIAVPQDALFDVICSIFGDFLVLEQLSEGIKALVVIFLSTDQELLDKHVVFGQGCGLAGANFIDSSHDLWCLEFFGQDELLLHLLDGVGKADRNG